MLAVAPSPCALAPLRSFPLTPLSRRISLRRSPYKTYIGKRREGDSGAQNVPLRLGTHGYVRPDESWKASSFKRQDGPPVVWVRYRKATRAGTSPTTSPITRTYYDFSIDKYNVGTYIYTMNNDKVPTRDKRSKQLQAWVEATELEIQEITAALTPLQQRLQAARERLDLIQRLMRLEDPSASDVSSPGSTSEKDPPPIVAVRTRPGRDVEDDLEAILLKAGQPMHIRDLRQALIDRGVPLPGRGDEANIILRLSRAKDRFVRTGRGNYGLSKWGIESVPPVQRIKRVYRKRKARQ